MDAEDEIPMATETGASGEVEAALDEEPTWQQSTVLTSEQAAKSGSQWPEWIEGICSVVGFSEKVTAWHPCRPGRTSCAALSTSKRGRIPQGMNRSG